MVSPTTIKNNVPVFEPSLEEFTSTQLPFMDQISEYAKEYGILKIIPPLQWNIATSYDDDVLDSSDSDILYKQVISVLDAGKNIITYRNIKEDNTSRAPTKQEQEGDLQAAEDLFWDSIGNPQEDTNHFFTISNTTTDFFPNLNNSSSNTRTSIAKTRGNFTLFSKQTKDSTISINHLIKGSPKQWYSLSLKDKKELLYTNHHNHNHDHVLISPSTNNDYQFHKIVQFPNELIIIYPNNYYYGFDYGGNVSISTTLLDTEEEEESEDSGKNSLDIQRDLPTKYDKLNEFELKIKNFSELLSHTSQELNQIEENKNNSPLSAIMGNYNLSHSNNNNTSSTQIPSLRSTTPNVNKDIISNLGIFNQHNPPNNNTHSNNNNNNNSNNNNNNSTISRISSPLLSRMMDLSNIIEPTLEDPTSKFKKKFANQYALQFSNNNGSSAGSSPRSHANTKLSTANKNSIHSSKSSTLNTLALLEDHDDNMLALSLATMANSRAASPRLTLPPINSAIDPSAISNTALQANGSNIPLNKSGQPIVSPKPSYNANPLSYNSTTLHNMPSKQSNLSNSSIPLSPSTSSLPFIKRLKSPNIVTLNISRETSRSPVSALVNDYRSPLGITNPLTYSSVNGESSGLAQLQVSELGNSSNNNNNNNHDHEAYLENINMSTSTNGSSSTTSTIQRKRVRSSRKNGNTSESSPSERKRQNAGNGQPTKFSSEEVVISDNGKLYICQECKRQFSSGHHLTRHKKSVHSGEKPHSCPKCGKKFKRRDHVLQHLNKKIPCTQEMKNNSNNNSVDEVANGEVVASSIPLTRGRTEQHVGSI